MPLHISVRSGINNCMILKHVDILGKYSVKINHLYDCNAKDIEELNK